MDFMKPETKKEYQKFKDLCVEILKMAPEMHPSIVLINASFYIPYKGGFVRIQGIIPGLDGWHLEINDPETPFSEEDIMGGNRNNYWTSYSLRVHLDGHSMLFE